MTGLTTISSAAYRIMKKSILFCLVFVTLCQCREKSMASKVEIVKSERGFDLHVNSSPFEVKGAGINWDDGHNYRALKEAGGNAFRTWGTYMLEQELDSAAKYNLMIAVGLDMEKELHGFSYRDNPAEVAQQLERIKSIVRRYKSHPNILCWVAGNELNLILTDEGERPMVDPSVYVALMEVVDFIHAEDPNHPVTTTFAGTRKSDIDLALKHCPDLDFLSLQVYGGLGIMPQLVKKAELDRPFMITEFGPLGHWEMPSTEWGREIEEPSAEKAKGLAERMRTGIKEENSGMNIGHFVFEWGQKQERTPTWYGIFNKSGEPDARIDEITKFWTGSYPENRAPLVSAISLNELSAESNVYLLAGAKAEAKLLVEEVDGDSLTFHWTIMKEVSQRSAGGAFEEEPPLIDFEILESLGAQMQFAVPQAPGDYRLFAYVYDGKGKVGNANIPFYVKNN